MDGHETTETTVKRLIAAEMTVLVQRWRDTLPDYNGRPFDMWLSDGLDWYLAGGLSQADPLGQDLYKCLTCNHLGSVQEVGCGHWRQCPNFAKAKAEGTLPDPFPKIVGGPTEANRG